VSRLLDDGRKIGINLKINVDEIVDIIKQMCKAAKQSYGNDILQNHTKLQIFLTGGVGDFSIYLKVNFKYDWALLKTSIFIA
jgi:hypothetical protein